MCFSLDQANMEAIAGTYLVNNAKVRVPVRLRVGGGGSVGSTADA